VLETNAVAKLIQHSFRRGCAAPLALTQFPKPLVNVSMAYVLVSIGGVLQHVC
jgi:hypothetical protein